MIDCKKKEKVLVVPRETSIKKFLINGGSNFSEEELGLILKDGVYGTRCLMEKNFNFKQIIPYIAFISDKKVLVYKRSQKSGEDRLHEKYSIGVGGHTDLEDDKTKETIDVLFDTAIREVEEEIGVEINRDDLNVKYFINDDSDDVGKVHFGVGFVINKNFKLDGGEEDIIVDRSFKSKKEVEEIFDKLESWSQIFYNGVVKDLIE